MQPAWSLGVQHWALVFRQSGCASPMHHAARGSDEDAPQSAPDYPKNVTILGLPYLPSLLHLVCPHGQPRYYLLLTDIHRFLAPLFTSIPSLFQTFNPSPYRDDP